MPDILNIMLRAAGSCGDSPGFLSAGHQPSGVPTSIFTQLSVGCSLWVISAFDPWLFRSVPDAKVLSPACGSDGGLLRSLL